MDISTLRSNNRHFLLVLEDEEADVHLYRHAFKTMDMADEVYFARDGDEGLNYLQGDGIFADRARNPLPTAVLLDLKMPGKNGFEILVWRQTDPVAKMIPTVVISMSDRKDDVMRAYQLGANAYFTKPADLRKLIALLTMIETFWEHAQLPTRLGIP